MSIRRVIFGVLSALLWSTAALLALETGARLYWWFAERDAASYINLNADLIPGMRIATQAEQKAILERGQWPGGAETPAVQPVRSWDGDLSTPDAEPVQRFWRLLTETEDVRNARATLDGDAWLLYGAAGEPLEEFGDPFVRQRVLPGTQRGALPLLADVPLLFNLVTGATTRQVLDHNPIWDYEITRHETTARDSGQPASLFHFRLLTQGMPYAEIAKRYPPNDNPDWLIPLFIEQPNLARGGTITDQFGFVNRPVTLPKPDGTLRIVCIGGSTTHEADVERPRTTGFLQQLFGETINGKRVEIINAGIVSNSSFEMRLHARTYLKYEPDLILYYEGINDILRWIPDCREGLSTWRKAALGSTFLKHLLNRRLLLNDAQFDVHWKNTTRRNLLAIQMAASEAGVPMAAASFAWADRTQLSRAEWHYLQVNSLETWGSGVATYDTLNHLLGWHNRLLKELCGQAGMGYIPLAEQFSFGMTHFSDLCHTTPTGMQERARVLHTWLRSWLEERITSQLK